MHDSGTIDLLHYVLHCMKTSINNLLSDRKKEKQKCFVRFDTLNRNTKCNFVRFDTSNRNIKCNFFFF
jgi:hypothetical protein